MIQRVFYGSLGVRPDEVPGWDLTAREHLELWPFAALFLAMGIASPFWMRAIDTYAAVTASQIIPPLPGAAPKVFEGYDQSVNPCAHILAEVRDHVWDANYDKMHHRGICNSDGTLVDPAAFYSQNTAKEVR